MNYKVGLQTLHLRDETRRSWDGKGSRPLITDVWYPAVPEAVETETLIGTVEAPLFTVGRAARDAEPIAGAFPVILLSHGAGGSALQMGWLAAALASKGYIAAGVNHHGNNALEPYTPEGFLLWWERAKDLSAALDLLLKEERIGAHLDPQRVGAAGFSLGGYTVITLAGGVIDLAELKAAYHARQQELLQDIPPEFPDRVGLEAMAKELLEHDESHKESYRDPRVRCVVAIAPALGEGFGREGLAGVSVPIKIIVGEADTVTPAESNGARFARFISNSELNVLDGQVGHYTFLGEGTEIGKQAHPLLCIDAPGVNRGAVHRRVASMAEEYFSRFIGAGRA